MLQPLWETVWQFLKELNLYLPYKSQQLYTGLFSQRNANLHPHKNPCVHVHGSCICNSPKLERMKMSFGRSLVKLWSTIIWKN